MAPIPAVIAGLALLAITLGWSGKALCLRTGGSAATPVLDWSENWPWTHYCYSDVVALYGTERFNQPGTFPYKTSWIDSPGTRAQQVQYTEYPVLTGLFMWVNAKLAQGYGSLTRMGTVPPLLSEAVYFNLVAVWLALAWLIVVWGVKRITRCRVWDAALVAASPLVVAQLFTNFDALAVALATLGLLAWSRRRPALAGMLLGLGGAAKLYPLFLLIPLLALSWRTRQRKPALRLVVGAAGSWAAVNAPIAVLFPAGWSWFYRFSMQRGPGFESLFTLASYFTHWGGFDGPLPPNHAPQILNLVSSLLFVGCCTGIVTIALHAPRRPRVPQLCLLTVIAFLLTGKVYSPQYSLWLVPLAVLALPRWRILLAWMTVDALVWIPTMLNELGVREGDNAEGYFLGAVLIRDAALLAICLLVLCDIYWPAHDPVRQTGQDDPCGGVFDGAQDGAAAVLIR